jgi:NAD(P)-dependent dehydrogenase (short-subunit alcohol dehydrogenase family)
MGRGRLAGFRVLVTGGSDGIGLAIAGAMVREGAAMWLVGRDEAKLQAATAQIGAGEAEVRCTPADLTQREQVARLAAEVNTAWPALDTLVNNAGMARFTALEQVTEEELEAQVALNLLAPFRLTQQLLPALSRSWRAGVINISSTSASRLIPGRPASVYAMTKGGVNSLTKALALELGPRGIRVNVIAPGTINTPLTERMINAMGAERRADYERFVAECFALGRRGDPSDVAAAAVYLASAEANWVTGSILERFAPVRSVAAVVDEVGGVGGGDAAEGLVDRLEQLGHPSPGQLAQHRLDLADRHLDRVQVR